MRFLSIVFFISIIFATSSFSSSTITFNSFKNNKLLLQELQKGGYSFYFRHSKTIREKRLKKIIINDCTTQRNLSQEGRELAKNLGKILTSLSIKFDKIYTSPYCRAKDTAELLFGKFIVKEGISYSMYDDKKTKLSKADSLKKFLSDKVKKGFNNALISHTSNLQDLEKIWLKQEMGLAVFKRQTDGSLKHIATINPEDWQKLGK